MGYKQYPGQPVTPHWEVFLSNARPPWVCPFFPPRLIHRHASDVAKAGAPLITIAVRSATSRSTLAICFTISCSLFTSSVPTCNSWRRHQPFLIRSHLHPRGAHCGPTRLSVALRQNTRGPNPNQPDPNVPPTPSLLC